MPMLMQLKEARLGLTSGQSDSKTHHPMRYAVAGDQQPQCPYLISRASPHTLSSLASCISFMSQTCLIICHMHFCTCGFLVLGSPPLFKVYHSARSFCSPVSPKCLLSLVASNKAFPPRVTSVTISRFSNLLLLPATSRVLPVGRNYA